LYTTSSGAGRSTVAQLTSSRRANKDTWANRVYPASIALPDIRQPPQPCRFITRSSSRALNTQGGFLPLLGFPTQTKKTEVHMYRSNVWMCAFAICCRITNETCHLFTRCVQSLNRGCHASGSSRVECFAHCQHIRLRLFSEEPDKR
jgi:hypothetical protein